MGYNVKEKKARRTLIRQPLPKKGKIKENNDVDDEDDDEIKALKIENNILKDKIKASKRPIKVLEQQHDRFTWKKT